MNTPTPRTDAEEAKARDYYERHKEPGDQPFNTDGFDFARTLERELTKDRDDWKAKHWKAHDDFHRQFLEMESLHARLAEVEAERDQLRKQLEWGALSTALEKAERERDEAIAQRDKAQGLQDRAGRELVQLRAEIAIRAKGQP